MALSESNYALEFLLSEAPGGLSRDEGTLLSGQSLIAGAVVGQITKAIAAAPIPTIVGTGTGLMSALTFGPDVNLPRLLSWLDRAEAAPNLWEMTG